MRMRMTDAMIVAMSLLMLLALSGCGGPFEDTGPYLFSGTLAKAGIADGTVAHVRIVGPGADYDADAAWSTEGVFAGGTAAYSIDGVAGGSWRCWIFIDEDANAVAGNPLPDTGDWVLPAPVDLAVDVDQGVDVADADWVRFGLYTISGTLDTGSAPGERDVFIKLVSPGWTIHESPLFLGKVTGSGLIPYEIPDVPAGEYGFYVFIDDVADVPEGEENPVPGTGDPWHGDQFTPLAVAGDVVRNVANDEWSFFSTVSVTGTLERPEGTGRMAYVKLVGLGGPYDYEPLYSTSVFVETDTADYSIPGVMAGFTYSCWAFVDMNGNATETDYLPDVGDWYYGDRDGTPAVVAAPGPDLDFDLPAASWTRFGMAKVSGTLSYDFAADGVIGYVKLVAAGAAWDAEAIASTSSSSFASQSASYLLWAEPGSYTAYAFIDNDGDAATTGYLPEHGDYWSASGASVSIAGVGEDVPLDFLDSWEIFLTPEP